MTWKAGVNHLTDRLPSEIESLKGLNKDLFLFRSNRSSKKISKEFLKELPPSIDWRDQNVLTPIKDQDTCGSCWAFSASAVLESHIAIQTGKLLNLSEQQMVDCTPNPHKCGGSGGCNGATQELAFDYVQKNGIALSVAYSYKASQGKCKDSTIKKSATVEGFLKLPENDYDALMNAVATIGPIAISVAADQWAYYRSGVFNGNCGSVIDHAVTLIGYGTDKRYGNYWIVRNSWSTNWGERGHIRIKRENSASEVECETDPDPASGGGCEGGPDEITVCGKCGILSDSSYVTGGKLS
jgi:cathepsin L